MGTVDHIALANNFKYLMWVILAVIAMNVGSFLVKQQPMPVQLMFLGVALVITILLIIMVVKTTDALGWSTGGKVGAAICMFIPCVSLIMLIVINSAAVKALKAAGYKVGLMGATR